MADVSTGPRLRLTPDEAAVLRDLVRQMAEMLEGPMLKADPAVRRLFPDAYPDDPDDQRGYDELLGDSLRSEKATALDVVAGGLGPSGEVDVTLTEAEAEAWLTALTDMRLAIGERVGVTLDVMASPLDPRDPNAPALSVMHWLGWIQESLLAAMS